MSETDDIITTSLLLSDLQVLLINAETGHCQQRLPDLDIHRSVGISRKAFFGSEQLHRPFFRDLQQ